MIASAIAVIMILGGRHAEADRTRARVRRSIPPVILACAAAGLLAAPASAAPRITSPAEGALVKGDGGKVRVVVRGVGRNFEAMIGSRDVSGRFRRSRGGRRRTAVLHRGRHFKRGTHRLVVASGRGANRRHAARTFVGGKRLRGTLRVKHRRRSRAPLRVRVRGAKRGFDSVRVRLNGKRVRTRDWVIGRRTPASEWPHAKRRFRAMLGADDGLRYGRNRLVVTTWAEDGRFDRAVVRTRIKRSAPLVGAGRGRHTIVGRRVILNGRRTRAAGGAKVGQRWRIVRAPRGSRAKLRRARTKRPRLVADRPGRYRVRLIARAKRAGAKGARARRARAGAAGLSPRAIDEVTVTADPDVPPIGAPIETITPSGAIELDGKTYAAKSGAWAQLLVLDRATLEVKSNQSFGSGSKVTLGDVEALERAIIEGDTTELVVLSGGVRGVQIETEDEEKLWNQILVMLLSAGASTEALLDWPDHWQASIRAGRWSVIGVPGVEGSAHHNIFGMLYGERAGEGSEPGALTGYLQEDQNDHFAFASGNKTKIDTRAPDSPANKNIVRVGSQHYTSGAVPDGQAGFHMVVLNSTLDLIFEGTFITTGDDPQNDLQEMQRRLNQYALDGGEDANPGYLVIVQSMGNPSMLTTPRPSQVWVNDGPFVTDTLGENPNVAAPRNEKVWGTTTSDGHMSVAGMVATLGGAGAHDQFAALNDNQTGDKSQGYTLIASTGQLAQRDEGPSPADPGSVPLSRLHTPLEINDPPPSRVVGTLSRDRQSLWNVDIPGLAGSAEESSLAEVAYQEPTAWPVSSTAGQKAANAYITKQLGFDAKDLRIEYYEDSGQDWNTVLTQLQGIDWPGSGHGFTENTFNAVKEQLATEVLDVSEVWTLIGEWESVFTTSEINGFIDLQTIAGQIEREIHNLDTRSDTTGKVEAIIGDSLFIADEVLAVSGQEEAAAAVGVTAGVFDVASDATTTRSGGPSMWPVEVEVPELGAQLAQRYGEIQSSIASIGAILVSDWGKLKRAAENTKGPWAWDRSTTPSNVKNTLTTGAEREFWAALLSTVYGVYAVDPPYIRHNWPTPWKLFCQNGGNGTHPFGTTGQPPSSWVSRPVGLKEDGEAKDLYFGLNTKARFQPTQGGPDLVDNPSQVPQKITGPLFAQFGSGSGSGALGAEPQAFLADSRFDRWWFWCIWQ